MTRRCPRPVAVQTFVLATVLGLGWFACQPSSDQLQSSLPLIIVVNLDRHPALAAVQKGTVDALAEAGYIDDETAELVIRNAFGDLLQAGALAHEIAAQDPKVTVAISTPIALAVLREATAPVVFAASSDPVGAGIVSSLKGDEKITGSSDAPYEAQLKLVRRILPDAQRLGLLFDPGEAISQHTLREFHRIAPALGFELIEGPATNRSEIRSMTENLSSSADFLLLAIQDTVAADIAAAVEVSIQHQVPLFACDSDSVAEGAIAAVLPDYYQIGMEAGRLAARLLKGERNLPVVLPSGGEIHLNTEAARRQGVKVPEDVVREAAALSSRSAVEAASGEL